VVSSEIILVDENDNAIGTTDKMEAHQKGLRHRAFSIFIFNSKGEMLLQKRAANKYHSAGLWSNACCSHPSAGEETKEAALRRLNEELGFKTPIQKIFDFTYKADFENGLKENEFDHVFVGEYESEIKMNPEEVEDYSFKSINEIQQELANNPSKYTAWFKIVFSSVVEKWRNEKGSESQPEP
jgi:isopentenyl-diphosphate delta-isomerase